MNYPFQNSRKRARWAAETLWKRRIPSTTDSLPLPDFETAEPPTQYRVHNPQDIESMTRVFRRWTQWARLLAVIIFKGFCFCFCVIIALSAQSDHCRAMRCRIWGAVALGEMGVARVNLHQSGQGEPPMHMTYLVRNLLASGGRLFPEGGGYSRSDSFPVNEVHQARTAKGSDNKRGMTLGEEK